MSEEQSLPTLPTARADIADQLFQNNPRKRALVKAHAPSSSAFNSSDPAVFSSDDDPGLDNYVNGRRKRRYKGSWFHQRPIAAEPNSVDGAQVAKPQAKRTFARQYDSGVFLGSDATEDNDIGEKLEVPIRTAPPPSSQRSPATRRLDPEELAIQEVVREALENGNETIDLWSMGIKSISNSTMNLLSQFTTTVPVVTKGVAFEPKEPELQLYIAKNYLTTIPGTLFDITHLTILSLRGNHLTSLPPGIAKLQNLRELNLAANDFRHLPVELLDLFEKSRNLRSLTIHPNPFTQPKLQAAESLDTFLSRMRENSTQFRPHVKTSESGLPSHNPRMVSCHLALSQLQVRTSSGRITSDFTIPTGTPYDYTIINLPVQPNGSDVPRISRVPSLLEAALEACYKTSNPRALCEVMPPELPHLRSVLEEAATQKETGGLVCSKCRKTLLLAPLEWIEWRQLFSVGSMKEDAPVQRTTLIPNSITAGEIAVPFLHRACSWLCGPQQITASGEMVKFGEVDFLNQ